VASRTFHSAALRQLNYFWADHVGGAFPRIISDRNDFARRALDEAGLPSDLGSSLLADLDLLGATGTVPEHPQGLTPVEFQAARNAYEGLKRAENCIDFADVLLILIGLLETRAIVRDTVRRQYRWFTVDEFQDTSPIQMRLLRLWLGERRDLCVVGDPAQAIYGFAGADASFLRRFHIEFEEAAVVQLANSYRCARSIVATANSVARDIPDALQLRSMSGAGTRQLLRFPDTDGQARGIAHEVA
ncbi:MAG: ATP-dependent helicase, partial [Actinobacteria bacterium]|nr:ATP-dependent helicase [Actinomycetota bacterium]